MGHVAGIGQTERSHKIFIGKHERKRKLGRPQRRWKYNLIRYRVTGWATIVQSVQRLATRWMVQGLNPGGGEVFRTRPEGPASHSDCYKWVPGLFPEVKRPGRGVDRPPHLAPRLKKEWSYKSTPPVGLHDLFQSEIYLYPYTVTGYGLNVAQSFVSRCKSGNHSELNKVPQTIFSD